MKLEKEESIEDMRDKIVVKVSKFKRTAKGYRCTTSMEIEWRAADESFHQYIKMCRFIDSKVREMQSWFK